MDKVLLYEEDMELRASIVAELTKYAGQFDFVVVTSFSQARELIQQKMISICVVGFDMENPNHVNFLSTISTQYTQVPFILMSKKSPVIETNGDDIFNILTVINKPFELSLIPDAIIEGLDAIDEGMLWRRLRSFGRS